MTKLLVKRESPTARLPEKGSDRAAGYDLFADLGSIGEKLIIYPGNRKRISAGISVSTPPGTYFRVAPRSGHADKSGVDVLAGVVDEDYTGLVGVILLNTGGSLFTVNHGDKIAQGIVEVILHPEIEEVDVLPETRRGEAGFGSTGN